jgi:hypothetical protein
MLTPLSVARQHANRNISAPFAWHGKLRIDRGLASGPTRIVHPKTVESQPNAIA